MSKLKLALCVVLVGAIASPAVAGVVFTPVGLNPGGPGTVGIYNPGDPNTLNTVRDETGVLSQTYVFTFALQMSATYYPDILTFSFVYDNSSIEVLGASPAGPWAGEANSYEGAEWPNTSHGIQAVDGLTQHFTTGWTTASSSVMPFFKVTLHVKSATMSQENAFGITLPGYGTSQGYGLTLDSVSHYWYANPGDFAYHGGVIHEVPEPSSALLLGGAATGVLALIRRRR